jgi:hypothetical protein
MRKSIGWLAASFALNVAACGGGAPKIAARVHFIHGAGTAAPGAAASRSLIAEPPRGAALAMAGRWDLSPDQAKVIVSAITLLSADGRHDQRAALTNCAPTYSRSQGSGVELLNCPFELPAGTYQGVALDLQPTAQVLFNDPVNGFYSDPSSATLISATAPAGGAAFVSYTPSTGSALNYGVFTLSGRFIDPFVLGSASGGTLPDGGPVLATADVYVTTDLVHTMFGFVNGSGQLTLDGSLPIPPVFVRAAIGGAPKEVFYTATGSAGNVFECPSSSTGVPCTNDDNYSVRILYGPTSQQPIELFGPTYGQVHAGDAAKSAVQPDGCRLGGYLGFDGTNVCWAMPTNCGFTGYAKICSMTPAPTLGSTTTIRCQHLSNAPPPTSGATYASGCPALTPDETTTVTFVAH